MKTYKIMNYEPSGSDVQIGKIIATANGEAVLELNADGGGKKKPYKTVNAALYEVRNRRGWPSAYLGTRGDVMDIYNVGGNLKMNAKQNTDTERLDFLFKVETVEFSKNLDGKYCCFLYDQEVDIHGFGDSYRAALDEAMAQWEDISCLAE